MTTTVVLIRHAAASKEDYQNDTIRPLSEEGKSTQRHVSSFLKQEGYSPHVIFHSPFLRAKQTAEILAEFFPTRLEEEETLGVDFDEEKLLKHIPDPHLNQTVFFVGHAPTMEDFALHLTGKNCLPAGLSKSGAVTLQFPQEIAFGKAVFLNYFHPGNIP